MRTLAAVLALVACVHAGMWALLRHKETAPNFTGQLASVSYYPFAYTDNLENGARPTAAQIRDDLQAIAPYIAYTDVLENGARPTAAQIRADLKAIAPYTRAVRTYSSTDGSELVPAIAAEFGLKVTVGAWLSRDQDRNHREIEAALNLANHNSNVNAIVVGNETLLRGDVSAEDLIKLIRKVKSSSPVPVTTAEIWTEWIDHPELAPAVDFIAAHILPYWEGVDASHALDRSIEFYDKLRQMYPGKRIVIAEFGWPSAGYNFHDANPGRIEQAMVIRDFVNWAAAYGVDYNVVDAIDQPGKRAEGGVGPYWGLFDTSHEAKFAWTGPITDPDYIKQAGLAVLLGVLLSLPILTIAGMTVTQAAMLAISANLVGAWFTAIVAFWKGHYFVPGAAFALGLGLLLLMPLIAIALSRLDEIAAIAFGRPPRRLTNAPSIVPDGVANSVLANSGLPNAEGYAPKVSIHVPACCESPDMLNLTLDSVARLDYPNLECVVVINNTPDPALWQPVEDALPYAGRPLQIRADR